MIDLSDGKELFDRVESLRLKNGWSTYELAKKAGVSSTTIYSWRDSSSLPSLFLLEALCDVFNISMIEFLMDDDERAVSDEHKELVRLWDSLADNKKKLVIEIMRAM